MSRDIGWQHGQMIDNNRNKIICNYCQKKFMGGGVSRLKGHLAGGTKDVSGCTECGKEIRQLFKGMLAERRRKKADKKKGKADLQESMVDVNQPGSDEDDNDGYEAPMKMARIEYHETLPRDQHCMSKSRLPVTAAPGGGAAAAATVTQLVGQVVIPGTFVELYKHLVARFGEIVPPQLSKVKKCACEGALSELLDVVSSIHAKLPSEITSDEVNSWEEMATDCASIGLRMDWFLERMGEYRNWLARRSSGDLEALKIEIAEKDIVLAEKRQEIKTLEEELIGLKATLAAKERDICSILTFF